METETKNKSRETPARTALRQETRGLILLALAVLVVFLVRYCHLLHRGTP